MATTVLPPLPSLEAPPLQWHIAPPAPATRPGVACIDVAAYTAAVGLAAVAAFFSIKGMVVLFPAAPLAIVAMATMMEASKLVAAGWLAQRWCSTAGVWRFSLIAFVAGLAMINATGVFSQLVAAHVGERGAATSAIETKDAALAAKIDVATNKITDLKGQIGQIDATVAQATDAKIKARDDKDRTKAADAIIRQAKTDREALSGRRQKADDALADLKAERAALGAKGKQIETEAAPIRYVAELIGTDTDSERAIRWLILMMVLCCDPLAIALTAAASARR